MNAHKDAPHIHGLGPDEFRIRPYDGGPYKDEHATCSYCGSIEPGALLELMKSSAEVKLDMADWKYGWPHKFYVEGIVNPIAGQEARITSTSGPVVNGRARDFGADGRLCDRDATPAEIASGRYESVKRGTLAPATVHAKFYSEHMVDIEGDAFEELSNRIAAQTGVTFEMRDDKLYWKCPRRH